MSTLTLQLDETILEKADAYSKRTGRTVNQLVADFLQHLPEEPVPGKTPIVRSLRGVLRGASLSTEDYRRHLEEKYL